MRVLFIGEEPESVDFNAPALPPRLTAERSTPASTWP
jgi:hypothetical protein